MENLIYGKTYKDHEFCLRCGRRLKNLRARELGYGQICYRKMSASFGREPLFGVKVKEEDRPETEARKMPTLAL